MANLHFHRGVSTWVKSFNGIEKNDIMEKMVFTNLLIVCLSLTACCHTQENSEYNFEGRTIMRTDWDNVLTELKYYDSTGNEMGSVLFYYPGRDGWFLVDNIWDTEKVYLLLCDACPKIKIMDSTHFVVLHDISLVQHIDKSRWIRISSKDDMPVVRKQNNQYRTKIKKIVTIKRKRSEVPTWDDYPGELFHE